MRSVGRDVIVLEMSRSACIELRIYLSYKKINPQG